MAACNNKIQSYLNSFLELLLLLEGNVFIILKKKLNPTKKTFAAIIYTVHACMSFCNICQIT